MSEVISFRLDPDNPREAQALVVLRAWAKKGYSIRHIMSEALINFGEGGGASISNIDAEKITSALDKITQLMDCIHFEKRIISMGTTKGSDVTQINDDFIASLKNMVKPGLNI